MKCPVRTNFDQIFSAISFAIDFLAQLYPFRWSRRPSSTTQVSVRGYSTLHTMHGAVALSAPLVASRARLGGRVTVSRAKATKAAVRTADVSPSSSSRRVMTRLRASVETPETASSEAEEAWNEDDIDSIERFHKVAPSNDYQAEVVERVEEKERVNKLIDNGTQRIFDRIKEDLNWYIKKEEHIVMRRQEVAEIDRQQAKQELHEEESRGSSYSGSSEGSYYSSEDGYSQESDYENE